MLGIEKSAQVRPVPWLELNTGVNFTCSADYGADMFYDVKSGSLRRPASTATLHRSILSAQVTRGQGGKLPVQKTCSGTFSLLEATTASFARPAAPPRASWCSHTADLPA